MSSTTNSKTNNDSNDSLTFKNLGVCSELIETIEKLGWVSPTAIQAKALPFAFQGRDVIGLAETGSGKTGSFAIPVIQDLLKRPSGLFACVLAPTRELAYQIGESFEALGSHIGLTCCVIIGGVDTMSQAIALAKRPHVIVATPGRLVWHLQNTKGFQLKTLRYLIFDEADRLLNMDFEDDIDAILSVVPKQRTTYMYSATMTGKVKKLQRASLTDPVKVEVSNKYQTVSTLDQRYLFVPAKFKDVYLAFVLNEHASSSAIIFVSTCNASTRIALILRNLGFSAVPINGQMPQGKRLGALKQFKSQKRNILVATDVASRGLDIPQVDLVVNFELPISPKDYIHRVGRTARAGSTGKSISIVTQYDVEIFQRIEQFIGKKMELYATQESTVLILLDRVSQAQRFAAVQMKEMTESKSRGRGSKRSRIRNADDQDNPEAHHGVTIRKKGKRRKSTR